MDFADIGQFDWLTADVWVDDRHDYGEVRKCGLGLIGCWLCIIIFTPRGERFRLISLRKANPREKREWENR